MNFVEKLIFTPQRGMLSSLQGKQSDELAFLFPKYTEYCQMIELYVYDVREILCEKIRSILTRAGFKTRDFFDIYLICKKFNLSLEDMIEPIVEKISTAISNYQKYQDNFNTKKASDLSLEPFRWGKEKELVLQEIDEKEFDIFLGNLQSFLKKITEKFNTN